MPVSFFNYSSTATIIIIITTMINDSAMLMLLLIIETRVGMTAMEKIIVDNGYGQGHTPIQMALTSK